jgi:hypothetical protein
MSRDLSRRDAVRLAGTTLASVGVAGAAVAAANPPTQGASLTVPNFAGKTVVLYTRRRMWGDSVLLTDCAFELQGGRLFLLGTTQEDGHSRAWSVGLRRAIAWDRVEEYLVLDSLEQYRERTKISEEDSEIPF